MYESADKYKKLSVNFVFRDFSGTMKEILGTAQSVGCTVDGMVRFFS